MGGTSESSALAADPLSRSCAISIPTMRASGMCYLSLRLSANEGEEDKIGKRTEKKIKKEALRQLPKKEIAY